jgi:hypothetical protein
MANGLFNLKQVMQAVQQSAWVAQKPPAVNYLVVAGGGGTVSYGGGGGGGGLLTGSIPVATATSYTVTVGGGGSIGANNGSNSVFGPVTATGGGFGNNSSASGGSGGSGGGGGGLNDTVTTLGGQGTSGQGNTGGAHPADPGGTSTYKGAGGGGGAGAIGGTGITLRAGNGGSGVASAISGTVTTYAGGGGGSGYDAGGPVAAGVGGAGGGGNGGYGGAGSAGTAFTGGGGGGGTPGGSGFAGGSGVVIVSYPDTYAAATTVNATASTSGSGSILFNGSSQYLSTSATQVIPATGDFTIEAWIYLTSFSGSPVFCGQGSAGDPGRTLFYISTGGVPTFSNGSSFTFTSTGTVSLNTWTYIAFTRSGNTGTWYINGASAGTGSLSGITIQNTFVTIGGSNPLWTAQYFTGYISNFRISDVARTISSTPTAPFNPSTANTKMLLSTASGAFLADASTNAYTFTNNGTSTWNQLSPFATGSGYKNRVYTWTTSGSITF